jgi:hypothetical protein
MAVGLLGWGLSGTAGSVGLLIGGFGTLATMLFTIGFLYPLKILVAFLQAFIFVMLAMMYISGALEAEHGHESGHGPAAHGAEGAAPH